MSDLNKFMGIGRLVNDPQMKNTPSGTSICKFTIAINENWTDKNGQKQERAEFVNVTVFGRAGEAVAEYMTKGKQVYVEGKLKTDKWDKDGETRYSTGVNADKVLFLGGSTKREDNSF